MRTLYVIEPNGSVSERQYDRLPESKVLEREFFAGQWSEHVVCLWQGKRAHAFVDETGKLKGLPVNLKASAIYQNAERRRQGFGPYTDLAHDPRTYVLRDIPLIHGRMILWPHSAPGWEPDGQPWREHVAEGSS